MNSQYWPSIRTYQNIQFKYLARLDTHHLSDPRPSSKPVRTTGAYQISVQHNNYDLHCPVYQVQINIDDRYCSLCCSADFPPWMWMLGVPCSIINPALGCRMVNVVSSAKTNRRLAIDLRTSGVRTKAELTKRAAVFTNFSRLLSQMSHKTHSYRA